MGKVTQDLKSCFGWDPFFGILAEIWGFCVIQLVGKDQVFKSKNASAVTCKKKPFPSN